MRTTGSNHISEIFGTDPVTFPEARPAPALLWQGTLESGCAGWHHPQGSSCGERDTRSVLTGVLPVPCTDTHPCPTPVWQTSNAALFLPVKAKGSQDLVPTTYLMCGVRGEMRGGPALLYPRSPQLKFCNRRHLVQLAVKSSKGSGCQTCAAGDCWLGASSKFGTTRREPTHLSAGVLPSRRATAEGPCPEKGKICETSWGWRKGQGRLMQPSALTHNADSWLKLDPFF